MSKFRLQLIWPVLLRGTPDESPGRTTPIVNAWADWFVKNAQWSDPLTAFGPNDMTPIPDEYTYEEAVYFHPFFRDILMGDGGTAKKDLSARFLTRDDVRQVRVEIGGLTRDTFDVGWVQLHLFKPCVALLCVGVSAAEMSLWELQRFQDCVRRIYPPFWDEKGQPGLSPKKVTWLGADGSVLCASDLVASQDELRAFTRAGAEPPVCAHWQHFFGPLPPLKTRGQILRGERCYQQVTDERVPAMSYFAVPDPDRIAEGDFDRLTFVDDPNDSDDAESHPYDPKFLSRSRADYRYERFSHSGTTYLCSGYGFTVVGKSGEFFERHVATHFRRHYFRMGLVAHYQRAALLYFSDQLSDAMKMLAGLGPDEELNDLKFREHLEALQMNFLKFRSRAYFPEVTNQLQGQELWQLWFRHLNSQALFDLVDSSCQRVTAVLAEHETRGLASAQMKLARVATWGLGISIFVSVFALVCAVGSLYPEPSRTAMAMDGALTLPGWLVFWLGLAVCCAVVAVLLFGVFASGAARVKLVSSEVFRRVGGR